MTEVEYDGLSQHTEDWGALVDTVVTLAKHTTTSRSIFVMVSFSNEGHLLVASDSFPDVCHEFDLDALRVDESRTDEGIITKIEEGIRNVNFVIVGLTQECHNVYYELGLTNGFSKRRILAAMGRYEDPLRWLRRPRSLLGEPPYVGGWIACADRLNHWVDARRSAVIRPARLQPMAAHTMGSDGRGLRTSRKRGSGPTHLDGECKMRARHGRLPACDALVKERHVEVRSMTDGGLLERLEAPGPKRLLALDGGGLRGLISLGYLREVERILRERYGRPDLALSEYFDLIGGTSTGAIIATMLALGQSAHEVYDKYSAIGTHAFRPRRSMIGPLGRLVGPKFDDVPLMALLSEQFGERTLGSTDLQTGLMIVTKRADTSSVWPLVNLPSHKYSEMNRDLLLRDVVAWSTAAPTYFKPHRFENVGDGRDGTFVDGGVSMHNSPALQLLMVATLSGFGLGWPLGEDRILLCSVGTGGWDPDHDPIALEKANNLTLLATLMVQMMHDAAEFNATMLQWMSQSQTARHIDGQIEALQDDLLGPHPLLTYLRYDVDLEEGALAKLELHYTQDRILRLREMSDVRNVEDLRLIGQRAAEREVAADHFPATFDPAQRSLVGGT